MDRQTIRLPTMPRAEFDAATSTAVVKPPDSDPDEPYWKGHGTLDLACGFCGWLVAQGLSPDLTTIENIYCECPRCHRMVIVNYRPAG